MGTINFDNTEIINGIIDDLTDRVMDEISSKDLIDKIDMTDLAHDVIYNIDMGDLADDVCDHIDMDVLARDVLDRFKDEIDISSHLEDAIIDGEVFTNESLVNLASSYNPGNGCGLGNAVTNLVEKGSFHLFEQVAGVLSGGDGNFVNSEEASVFINNLKTIVGEIVKGLGVNTESTVQQDEIQETTIALSVDEDQVNVVNNDDFSITLNYNQLKAMIGHFGQRFSWYWEGQSPSDWDGFYHEIMAYYLKDTFHSENLNRTFFLQKPE